MKKKHDDVFLGCKPSQKDFRDYKYVPKASPDDYPMRFELPLGVVKNQGNVNSCVAHALSTLIEYFNAQQLGFMDEMSIGFIYGNRRTTLHFGAGMYIRDTLKAMRKYGDIINKDFAYNVEVPEAIELFNKSADKLMPGAYQYRISTFFKLKIEDIKHCLVNNGPVVIALKWYSGTQVVDGILTQTTKDASGLHCVLIYGWDDEQGGWLMRNSWGDGWGNNGTAILPYEIEPKEIWGVTDNITSDTYDINKAKTGVVWNIIYNICNFFANIFRKK